MSSDDKSWLRRHDSGDWVDPHGADPAEMAITVKQQAQRKAKQRAKRQARKRNRLRRQRHVPIGCRAPPP